MDHHFFLCILWKANSRCIDSYKPHLRRFPCAQAPPHLAGVEAQTLPSAGNGENAIPRAGLEALADENFHQCPDLTSLRTTVKATMHDLLAGRLHPC